jgi:hypothetical protein
MNRRINDWLAMNRETNGRTARNLLVNAALASVILVMIITSVQLLLSPLGSKPTYVNTVVLNPNTGFSSDQAYRNYILSGDIPFYNANDIVTARVEGGCQYGSYWIYVDGLTPHGTFWAQTDWDNTGSFNYGDGGKANKYGQATYTWSCDLGHGAPLPSGWYDLHITDVQTGFSTTVHLYVGMK